MSIYVDMITVIQISSMYVNQFKKLFQNCTRGNYDAVLKQLLNNLPWSLRNNPRPSVAEPGWALAADIHAFG